MPLYSFLLVGVPGCEEITNSHDGVEVACDSDGGGAGACKKYI